VLLSRRGEVMENVIDFDISDCLGMELVLTGWEDTVIELTDVQIQVIIDALGLKTISQITENGEEVEYIGFWTDKALTAKREVKEKQKRKIRYLK